MRTICWLIAMVWVIWFVGNHEYKRGFTDGVQSRIDYEQGKDVSNAT